MVKYSTPDIRLMDVAIKFIRSKQMKEEEMKAEGNPLWSNKKKKTQ